MGKVLHASGSGYFPFCIQESTSPACVFPLETIMKIYWRVKRFQLTGSGIGTYPPPFEDITGTFNFNPVEIPQTYANSEENLVCASGFSFNRSPDFGGIVLNQYTANKNNLNLFSLNFTASFSDDGIRNSLGGENGFNAFYGPYATTIPSTSLNIFGVNMPVYITIDGLPDDAYMGGDLQLTLTPLEYWSYGGTWNTSTGEPL